MSTVNASCIPDSSIWSIMQSWKVLELGSSIIWAVQWKRNLTIDKVMLCLETKPRDGLGSKSPGQGLMGTWTRPGKVEIKWKVVLRDCPQTRLGKKPYFAISHPYPLLPGQPRELQTLPLSPNLTLQAEWTQTRASVLSQPPLHSQSPPVVVIVHAICWLPAMCQAVEVDTFGMSAQLWWCIHSPSWKGEW